jgi:hypothetical protein
MENHIRRSIPGKKNMEGMETKSLPPQSGFVQQSFIMPVPEKTEIFNLKNRSGNFWTWLIIDDKFSWLIGLSYPEF